jgi:lysophospholipase L1-like esterase
MKSLLSQVLLYSSVSLLSASLTIALQPELSQAWLKTLKSPASEASLVAQSKAISQLNVVSQPAIVAVNTQTKPDTLPSQSWWQDEVQYRLTITQKQHYNHCLFGDSITSALGNTLGDRSFNFALSGMSSVSLVDELNRLVKAGVTCGQVIIAMGTNDADYSITNDQFVSNMNTAIALSRQMQAFRIVLLPAFYSTLAASRDSSMAGPIERVDQINELLRQVATSNQVKLTDAGLRSLYNGKALRDDLTLDGVHLNASGRVLYRNALLQLIHTPPF